MQKMRIKMTANKDKTVNQAFHGTIRLGGRPIPIYKLYESFVLLGKM